MKKKMYQALEGENWGGKDYEQRERERERERDFLLELLCVTVYIFDIWV